MGGVAPFKNKNYRARAAGIIPEGEQCNLLRSSVVDDNKVVFLESSNRSAIWSDNRNWKDRQGGLQLDHILGSAFARSHRRWLPLLNSPSFLGIPLKVLQA